MNVDVESDARSSKCLSLLVPMFNEERVIPVFFETVIPVLESTRYCFEVVCVDDGSSDNTLKLLRAQAENDKRIKVVAFSRNFGKEPAMTAALDYATGDAIIPIDADLQDPPELIHDMIARWEQGYDVVFARRAARDADSALKRNTALWFYTLFNKLSDTYIPANVGDFRLLDRKVVAVIKQLPEKDRFMKGLFCWPGFKSTSVDFDRPERADGDTKFNLWQLWNFAISGFASFSTMPIRAGIYVGLMISLLSFVYGLFIITKTLFMGIDVPGYASIMVVVLFLGGIQMFFLGLLGEYIGRIYKEVKNRPLYVVAETIGLDRMTKGRLS